MMNEFYEILSTVILLTSYILEGVLLIVMRISLARIKWPDIRLVHIQFAFLPAYFYFIIDEYGENIGKNSLYKIARWHFYICMCLSFIYTELIILTTFSRIRLEIGQ